MNGGPQPGDKILLVSAKDNQEVTDLLSFIFERLPVIISVVSTIEEAVSAKDDQEATGLLSLILGQFKLRITVAATAAEAVETLNQPFDMVWLHLPLLDLLSNYLLEELLVTPDLAGRVGSESPLDVLDRLTSINWYTKLSQQVLKDDPNEEHLQKLRSSVKLAKQARRKPSGRWLWIRIRTDEERAWVIQLLERNMTHDNE